MNMTNIEIFVMVDQDGDYVVHKDQDELNQAWDDEYSSGPVGNVRVFAMSLRVPRPQAVAVSATIPNTDGPVTITVA